MTEAPIPMTREEAVAELRALADVMTDRQLRAIDVLDRLAQRNRAASSSQTDAMSHFVRAREHLDDAKRHVDDGLSLTATANSIGAVKP